MCVCVRVRACLPKTWSVILREVYGLTFTENRVLRNVFEPHWEETTGNLRKLHGEKLNDFEPLNRYNLDEQIEE